MANANKNKVSVQELSDVIAAEADVSRKFSEKFLRELIDVIAEYLERDGVVKVKGLGTFKLLWVDGRRSVDVTTGNEIVLPAHYKVSFAPDKMVKNSVNEPYAHLSTVVTELPDDMPGGEKAPESQADAAADDEVIMAPEPIDDDYPEKGESPAAEASSEDRPSGDDISAEEGEPENNGGEDAYSETTPEEAQASEEAYPEEPSPENPQTDGGGRQPADVSEEIRLRDEENRRKNKSNLRVGIIVTIVVLALIGCGVWYSFNLSFPAGGGVSGITDVPTEEQLAAFDEQAREQESEMIYDVAVSDSAYGDSLAIEAEAYMAEAQEAADEADAEDSLAAEPEPEPDPFESYNPEVAANAPIKGHETVREGSRLTMVAYRAYGRKEFWVYIYDGNRDQLSSPSDIETGMVLKIPDLNPELTDPDSQRAIEKALELAKKY